MPGIVALHDYCVACGIDCYTDYCVGLMYCMEYCCMHGLLCCMDYCVACMCCCVAWIRGLSQIVFPTVSVIMTLRGGV